MVTIGNTNYTTTDKSGEYFIGDLRGLSTDTKPTEIDGKKVGNGTAFIEIDTQNIFFYDLNTKTWKGV